MRILTVLLASVAVMGGGAAIAGPDGGKAQAPGATTHWLGGPPPDGHSDGEAKSEARSQSHKSGGRPSDHRGGNGAGRPGDHRGDHRHGGGVLVVPFPYGPLSTYPYPYPYPGPYYPYPDDEDSSGPSQHLQSAAPPWPFWYYCEDPEGYYPYVKTCSRDWSAIGVSAPLPGAPAPVFDGTWAWCDQPEGYFQYIQACRKWTPVTVTAPRSEVSPGTPPAVAYWFYCDEPRGWMPYVSVCGKDWRAVPAVPPPNADKPKAVDATKAAPPKAP